jgi:hypothetical protein
LGQYLLLVKSGEAVESSSGVDGQATTNFLSVSPLAAASEMKKTTGNGDGLFVFYFQ